MLLIYYWITNYSPNLALKTTNIISRSAFWSEIQEQLSYSVLTWDLTRLQLRCWLGLQSYEDLSDMEDPLPSSLRQVLADFRSFLRASFHIAAHNTAAGFPQNKWPKSAKSHKYESLSLYNLISSVKDHHLLFFFTHFIFFLSLMNLLPFLILHNIFTSHLLIFFPCWFMCLWLSTSSSEVWPYSLCMQAVEVVRNSQCISS